MYLRDGRYERLRNTIKFDLMELEALYAEACRDLDPDDLCLSDIEDEMDEMALLLWELDEASPPTLRTELSECPPNSLPPPRAKSST